MLVRRTATATVAAPREHVAALLVRTDLETLRHWDPRVESVQTNGLPDGEVGQVVRMTARVWGQEVEIIQTVLVSELPELYMDRMEMLSDTATTRTRLSAIDASSSRIEQSVEFDVPGWKVLTALSTALTAGPQLRKALARFVETCEWSFRAA